MVFLLLTAMFSFTRGPGFLPICRVDGGKHNGKTIYLKTDVAGTRVEDEATAATISKLKCPYCQKVFSRSDAKQKHVGRNGKTNCPVLKLQEKVGEPVALGGEKGHRVIEKPEFFDELELNDGRFIIVPHRSEVFPVNNRAILSISGPSGSGKSFIANTWIGALTTMDGFGANPRKIVLCTPIEADVSFKNPHVKQIELNDQLAVAPISLDELKDSTCIFDDMQVVAEPIKGILEKLLEQILITGRHHNIDAIITSHLNTINGNKLKKDIMNESTGFVSFPAASSSNQILGLLKNCMNYDIEAAKKLMAMPSRWVYVCRAYPCFYVTQTKMGSARSL